MNTAMTVRMAAVVLACAAGTLRGAVIYVNAAATGAGTGTSWADARTSLTDALAGAAAGDEIWVVAGTYTPVDSLSSFVLKSGVGVYGGFAGTETARAQRDAGAHPTILSGDIGQDDWVDPSPFAPAWPGNVHLNSSNAGHVIVADGVDSTAVLDGFQIVQGAYGPAGIPAGDPLLYGSGAYCVGGSPTIHNCAFHDNFAAFGHGGAVFLYNSSPSITHCSFFHNLASQGSGGAIYVGGMSGPVIRDCVFTSNLATATYGQTGQGGAIQLDASRPVTVARCVFDGNVARSFGGGSYEIPRGGAISSFALGKSTIIRECDFRNNQSTMGGAVFVWNSTTVVNCLFRGNVAAVEGGALAAQWTTVTVLDCTLANNTAQEAAGIRVTDTPPNFPAQAVIRNTIVWGNIAVGQDVSPRNEGIHGPYSARYSCIQAMFTADPGEDPIDPAKYPGCIAVNPVFVNGGGSVATDFGLASGSPCIDTGGNSDVPAYTAQDLAGMARKVRGLAGAGPAVVDMGAYELGAGAACTAVVTLLPAPYEICPGGSASLGVSAAGAGPFTYQWRRNGANVGGATSAALTVTGAAVGAGATYDCLVTNGCGAVASEPVPLTTGIGFEIWSQPGDTSACAGQATGFSVSIDGWRPVTYQWRKDGAPIDGATDSFYTIASASVGDVGTYDCVIGSDCASVTSDGAAFTLQVCCPADFDGNSFVNGDDFDGFMFEFYWGNQGADFDGNGFVNGDDFDGFMEHFIVGC